MDYPTRHPSHIAETASFKRLNECLPNHWILRHASERDYGIDLLVEPVSHAGGPIVGDLMALQVKSTASLAWRAGNDPEDRRTTFSGTEVSTVNYWMGLPVPVFLCVHEHSSDAMYFAAVKRQVRRRYYELLSQATFGFELWSQLDLSAAGAELLLMALYYREQSYASFAEALTDLLINRESYLDYIESNVARDFFLEVETSEVVRLFRLYRNVQIVADVGGLKNKTPSLPDLIKRDRADFKDDYVFLHERTHDEALRAIAPAFLAAVAKGCSIVQTVEHDYWRYQDLILSRYVSERDGGSWLSEAKERLKWILTRDGQAD